MIFSFRRIFDRIYKNSFYSKLPFWDDPFFTVHDNSPCATDSKNCKSTSTVLERVLDTTAISLQGNIFVDQTRILKLAKHGISNVGATTITLFIILYTISLAVNFLNGGKEIPVVNVPDVGDYISSTFYNMVDIMGKGYDKLKQPFDGNQNLLMKDKDVFVCPVKNKGLYTIGSCFFHFLDISIYNAMDVIPATVIDSGNYTVTAFDNIIRYIFPEHFVVKDAINSIRLFIQRFLPLQNPATPKPVTSSGIVIDNSTKTNTKASFYFEPFSDDIRLVKDSCVSQCSSYATLTESFIFKDVGVQSSAVSTEMTIRDYFFNELSSTNIYICQYEQSSNFGGTWLLFDDTCLCSSSCSSADYFDFSGCADLLDRVGIQCSSDNACNIQRLCPFADTRLTITVNDESTILYTHINDVCLDICAELAGFGDFATLVALATASGLLPVTNAFGVFSSSFGSPVGVPTALIPGRRDCIMLSIIFLT